MTSPELTEGYVLAGRYRLEKQLGTGGMGTVWLAADQELDELPVAVKVIRPQIAENPEFVASLKDEAKNSMRLTHPNIVRVFNFHRDDRAPALPFLVLKYVEGRTL